jgi:hypothetical protein
MPKDLMQVTIKNENKKIKLTPFCFWPTSRSSTEQKIQILLSSSFAKSPMF